MPTSETIISSIPHSREAEEALLGSVLINPDIFAETGLSVQAFYIHRHKFIWQAYQSLKDKSRAIDSLTVCDELDLAGHLEEIGGPAYLTGLLNQVPTTLNADDYAAIVREHHTRRLLLATANEIARLSYSGDLGVSELMAQAGEALRKVSEQVSAPEQVVDVTDVASGLYDKALERSEQARDGKPISSRRIATGLADVDLLLKGGLRPGSLNLIAGRPGQGKSSWMQTVALAAAESGKRVGFFSLEMSREELAARLLSASSGLDANLITEGLLAESQWEAFITALEGLHSGRLFISDSASLTPATLRAQAWQMQSRHGLDLLVVDYLQLMRPGMRMQNREQEVAHCSRELKILAGELRIPVLAAAQLSRASETRAEKDPQLSDLRESGALENDADVVMFIWRPDEDKNVSRLKVAKHRGGPVGNANLYFDARLTRFANLAKKQDNEK
jgi:replicative DNA helicase